MTKNHKLREQTRHVRVELPPGDYERLRKAAWYARKSMCKFARDAVIAAVDSAIEEMKTNGVVPPGGT